MPLQLDLSSLGDGCHSSRQTAGQAGQHHLDRCGALVLGGEDLGMVGIEGELGLVLLLGAKPVESFDGGLALGAIDPLAGRPPLEFGAFRLIRQRFASAEQGFDIYTIIHLVRSGGHDYLLLSLRTVS
jgi:hypothetical protein